MNIKQGDQFHVQDGGTIEVTFNAGTHISFEYIHGSSRSGSVHQDYFEQLIATGYFKAVE